MTDKANGKEGSTKVCSDVVCLLLVLFFPAIFALIGLCYVMRIWE